MMHLNKKGFTLIELIIVLIIIGILSSIAAPMMGNMKAKVICSEAVAAMGVIRTALRIYYAEYNSYPDFSAQGQLINYPSNYFPGLDINSLTGVYFGKQNYFITDQYIICCLAPGVGLPLWPGAPSDAGRREETRHIADSGAGNDMEGYLLMRISDGKILQVDLACSGYDHL